MANRKRPQDKKVNAGHMPRTNGPCKKSPDGLHEAEVTQRMNYQTLKTGGIGSHWLGVGIRIVEYVRCVHCGKTGAGSSRDSTLKAVNVYDAMRLETVPTVRNSLDKLNEKHQKAST